MCVYYMYTYYSTYESYMYTYYIHGMCMCTVHMTYMCTHIHDTCITVYTVYSIPCVYMNVVVVVKREYV